MPFIVKTRPPDLSETYFVQNFTKILNLASILTSEVAHQSTTLAFLEVFLSPKCQLNLTSNINPLVFKAFDRKNWIISLTIPNSTTNQMNSCASKNSTSYNFHHFLHNIALNSIFTWKRSFSSFYWSAARRLLFWYLFTMAKWRIDRFHVKNGIWARFNWTSLNLNFEVCFNV